MLFDQEHRIGADACANDAKNKQNEMYNQYLAFNYFKECDGRENLQTFSTDNHMVYRDGFGSADTCTVNDDSMLRYGWEWTHIRNPQQLPKRVFTAIPDLSSGAFHADVESRLRLGEDTNTKKTCDPVSEVSTLDHSITPMLPCVKSVQDPQHIVPSWTWGGENTRDTVFQTQFLEENGYAFDGNVWKKQVASVR